MFLYELRELLEYPQCKKRLTDLFSIRKYALMMDGVIMSDEDSIHVIYQDFFYASYWWHEMKIVRCVGYLK
jgi:hypothetical protein